jgi:hypothetical protein
MMRRLGDDRRLDLECLRGGKVLVLGEARRGDG